MSDPTSSPPPWLTLAADEQVWYRTSPSWNLLLGCLGVGFLVLTGTSILVSVVTDLATGRIVIFTMLVLTLATIAGVFIGIERREYVLTSDGAYVGVGLLSKHVSSLALTQVREVTSTQSGWQQSLNVGSVRFVTDGASESVEFALIDEPEATVQHIRQIVDRSSR